MHFNPIHFALICTAHGGGGGGLYAFKNLFKTYTKMTIYPRAQGYITFFLLNSVEHNIYPAH